MPVAENAAVGEMAGWRLVGSSRAQGLLGVRKWASEVSGLGLTVAEAPGPMVHGHLVLATETDTDEGLPHTLEHLVFMGSKTFPYKGVLDLFANRCLASGTNAWTATDHTCYTLATAGQEGFLKLLPVYLDHLLRPQLAKAHFDTEVHHVTGTGEDAGVVYCEMQEHESKMSEMTSRALAQALYPEGCGYRYETGGRLEPLRTSTSIERVRDYHRAFYRPENLHLVVTGSIDEAALMKAVRGLEEELAKGEAVARPAFQRPWSTPVPPMGKSSEERLLCPTDDPTRGLVRVGWLGPKATDLLNVTAVQVLLEYLCDTAVAPLEARFVQVPEPLASSISSSLTENSTSYSELKFNGVPVGKLGEVKPLLLSVLREILDKSLPLDLNRMKDILRQSALRTFSALETEPHDTLAQAAIGDFLYGQSVQDFQARFNDVDAYKTLEGKDEAYWLGLLAQYLSPEGPMAAVIGEPSTEAVTECSAAEEARLAQQRERLGPAGLKAAGEALDAAVEANEASEPPDELIDTYTVNSLDGIRYVELKAYSSAALERDSHPSFRLRELPFTAQLDVGPTNFVRLRATMSTEGLSDELRPLLLLWESLLWESGTADAGYEEVVTALNRDLVDYEATTGVTGGSFHRHATLALKVHSSDWALGVGWLRRLRSELVFAEDRVRVVAAKLANSAASHKRDGDHVARFLLSHILYQRGSNPFLINTMRQEKLLARIAENPAATVPKLRALRDELNRTANLALHVTCDPEKLPSPAAWEELKSLAPDASASGPKLAFAKEPQYTLLEERRGVIASVGSCEAAHLLRVAPGPLVSEESGDLPALLLFTQLLSQCEGPLWCEIRGRGLAYGANIYVKADAGLIYLSLYRSSDPLKAYVETRDVVLGLLEEGGEVDESELESAKRSLIYEVIEREDSVASASFQSLLGYFRQVQPGYNARLCRKIWETKPGEAVAAGRKWLPGLFSSSAATATAVAAHPTKVPALLHGFQDLGEPLQLTSLDDPALSWDIPL